MKKMTDKQKEKVEKCNKFFAPTLFNTTWDLLTKGDKRAPEEDLIMIHTAHASAYHWRQIGDPSKFVGSEWQLSRVYAVLGRTQQAMFHAENSLELCKENGIGDFNLAFAYEAQARASAINGLKETTEKYLKLAHEASENIAKKEDKDYFLSELGTIRA
jgi:tetratricopeptide (TPR) repeat protein